MPRVRTSLFAVLLFALLAPAVPTARAQVVMRPGAKSQERMFDFFARGPFRPNVPRPEALLEYELGTRETTYWQQESVVRAIADAATDRVRYVRYGKTVEGRPLRVLAVSAPENIARLDAIRGQIARLADPRGATDADLDRVARETPIVVWINHNIHGNESASFESAMQLLYQLAASEEPKTLEILKNCVVIVNPSFNPDGHERFAVYHNSIGVGDPNNDALEHDQPWATYGRYNHYRFDMNRDKLALSQPETRQEIAEYLRWNPQVYVDQHGQTTQYFFPPVALPINTNTDVAEQQKWLDVFGRGNAAAFDRYGWGYYNRKIFDLLYAGYLDSWATLNGAIGMTYETDGGGQKGFAWWRDDDTVLTLRDGVARHWVAAMATLETASANREAKLRDYTAFRRASVNEGRTMPAKSVVIVPGSDPGRAAELVANLRRVGVEVGVSTSGFTSRGAHGYDGGAAGSRRFDAGVYVVDLAQPQGRLARAFLEPDATINPEFVKSELEKRLRNVERGEATPHEDAGFYDTTAWSLPLTYGVEAYWTDDAAPAGLQAVAAAGGEAEANARPSWVPEGRVAGGRGSSAYLWSYQTDGGARLALRLIDEGFRVAVSPLALKAGGRAFGRATLVARTERNPEALAARVRELARELGVEVVAVDSQYADDSTVGVGSEDIATLNRPRVCVAAGDGVSQESFGAIWNLLEVEYKYPFTAMELDSIPNTDLSRFNVIVLPDGSSGAYGRRLGKSGVERLRAWVENGGTIVALGGATAFLTDKEMKITTARPVGADEDQEKADDESDAKNDAAESAPDAEEGEGTATAAEATADKRKPKSRKEAESTPKEVAPPPEPKELDEPAYVPGAIFRARVDSKYFMSFGYDAGTLAVPVNTDLFLRPSKEGANVVTFGPQPKRLSGFVWPNNTERLLRGTVYVVDEPIGGGHVILFADDPNFRRLWKGTSRLFLNALLFAPTL